MENDRTKYPYYPWWVYDYQSDPLVQAMTDNQDLAYRRMLDVSWDLVLPKDNPDKIASLIRFSRRKFASVWKYPLTECWKDNGEGLVNPRLERERAKLDARYGQLKRASVKGVEARKSRTNDNRTVTIQSPYDDHTAGDPDPDPDSDPDPDPDPDPDNKRNCDRSPQGSFLNDGRSGSSAKPDEPVAPRFQRVKWDKEHMKLNASEEFKKEFLATWDPEFSREEIGLEVLNATRWLSKNPNRRGSKSRLDSFLHNWMKKALEDRVAQEEEEATTGRPVPPVPERKWCHVCRATLPRHAAWCKEDLEKGGE